MNFWDNALPLLKNKGIKQADLVRITGRAKSTVWNQFERKTIPAADDALAIADLLGVSVRFLVTGDDNSELTDKEKELLDACRGLSRPMMDKVIKEANDLKQMMMEEKRDYPESDMAVK